MLGSNVHGPAHGLLQERVSNTRFASGVNGISRAADPFPLAVIFPPSTQASSRLIPRGLENSSSEYGSYLNPKVMDKTNISYIWKGLEVCRDTLLQCVKRLVGDGTGTLVWSDP